MDIDNQFSIENTLYKRFFLHSNDYELLQRLLDFEYKDASGNAEYDYKRLKNIITSLKYERYLYEGLRNRYPKTFKIRFRLRMLSRYLHRRFKTKKFRNEILMCKSSERVAKKFGGSK